MFVTCEVVVGNGQISEYKALVGAVILQPSLHRLYGFERRWDAETRHKTSIQVVETCDFARVLYSPARAIGRHSSPIKSQSVACIRNICMRT